MQHSLATGSTDLKSMHLCRKQAFYVTHYASDIFLIGQRHHNELVAGMNNQTVTDSQMLETKGCHQELCDWKPVTAPPVTALRRVLPPARY